MADAKKPRARSRKRPFDVEEALVLLREAVAPYPKAALFELAAEGFSSVFEILVACIISIRTRDETTLPVARGDVLIFATDGIDHSFIVEPLPRASAKDCAEGLLNRYAKNNDDALVLTVRYLGLLP